MAYSIEGFFVVFCAFMIDLTIYSLIVCFLF